MEKFEMSGLRSLPDDILISEVLPNIQLDILDHLCKCDKRFVQLCECDTLWYQRIKKEYPSRLIKKTSTISHKDYYLHLYKSDIYPVYVNGDIVDYIRLMEDNGYTSLKDREYDNVHVILLDGAYDYSIYYQIWNGEKMMEKLNGENEGLQLGKLKVSGILILNINEVNKVDLLNNMITHHILSHKSSIPLYIIKWEHLKSERLFDLRRRNSTNISDSLKIEELHPINLIEMINFSSNILYGYDIVRYKLYRDNSLNTNELYYFDGTQLVHIPSIKLTNILKNLIIHIGHHHYI
ncbi:Hypothetical protein ORPV_485 [Orpheovirus IHUMI-LCC2]|uniref:Uncharacterized protein n=1 Tax=Orpheovirus IHUMI-LCC2 TaxID=2023057 RepID=A0A2I2L4J6_9VIRU|nr:Hypothetical protein ORPV_485 [Orpheovirus IHUMI-LCC2]SNW62389.1 Hypothetical protein ORPV_485 [Orpheovirus IHUMI-LCC2]